MNFSIRPAKRNEMKIFLDWAAEEGWNPGLYDAESFYSLDEKGFLLGFLDDEPIASLSAVPYNKDFGFLGFYITKPAHRGKGYGIRLWTEAMRNFPTQKIGLDGVLSQQENYKKSGFKFAYRHIRFEGKGSNKKAKENKNIIRLSQVEPKLIHAYDRKIFLHERKNFLNRWLSQPQSLALGYRMDKKLLGYGVIRKCRIGYKVGPLFADSPIVADDLFERLREYAGDKNLIYLDVPEPNKNALLLAKKFNMKPIFETARMYTGEFPPTPLSNVYGVTTFEVG